MFLPRTLALFAPCLFRSRSMRYIYNFLFSFGSLKAAIQRATREMQVRDAR